MGYTHNEVFVSGLSRGSCVAAQLMPAELVCGVFWRPAFASFRGDLIARNGGLQVNARNRKIAS